MKLLNPVIQTTPQRKTNSSVNGNYAPLRNELKGLKYCPWVIKLVVVIIPPVDYPPNPLLQWHDNFFIQLFKNRCHLVYFTGYQMPAL